MANSTQTVEVVITVESNADNTKFQVNNCYDFYARECFTPAEQVAIDMHLASLKPRVYEVFNAILDAEDRLLQGSMGKAEDATPLTGAEVATLMSLLERVAK